jgi:hypothetical protein
MGDEKATKRVLVLILLAVLGWPALAASQPQERQPRFEVGASAGLMPFLGRGGLLGLGFAGGPRLSVNLNELIGLDVVADIVEPHDSGGLYGLYAIQARHLLRAGDRTRSAIFITGGAVGGFEYERVPERRTERPDGSVVVYRAFTEGSLSRPVMFSGGIGMERVLTRFAAFRADGQLIFGFQDAFLVRAALGLSVPIGGTYARTR